ncbi:hypothetical protein DH09_18385 [Bacillaceae bacterium JMAK1]|nr:hypothetical protein DH09_18385 [Bacillaceae bacterium JMAK1]
MIHHVKFLRGLFDTKSHFSTLKESEATKGLAWRLIVSAILVGVLTFLSQWFVREDLTQTIVAEGAGMIGYEEASVIVTVVTALSGVFAIGMAVLAVLLLALVFWIFYKDVGFKKLFILFSYFLPIYIVTLLLDLPYYINFGLEHQYSVTSFGYLAHLAFDESFLTFFFGQFNLLIIGCFIVQVFALKVNTAKSTRYILLTTTLMYLVVMTLIALYTYFSMMQGVQ